MFKGGGCDAQFIPGERGRLFASLRKPAGRESGRCVLFVAGFGDEMNKTRRMLALTSAALADRGVASLLVDPFGTGDSEGEFGDLSMEGWLQDIEAGARWAISRGWQVDMLLGVRLGCAIAAAACERALLPVCRSVFWQPVLDGKRFMTQLLRMRAIASEMGDARETVSDLRVKLAAGEILEVGGYELSPRLARDIEELMPPVLARHLGEIHWIDVTAQPVEDVAAGAAQKRKNFRDAQVLHYLAVEGEPFWATTELVDVPELVSVTTGIFSG